MNSRRVKLLPAGEQILLARLEIALANEAAAGDALHRTKFVLRKAEEWKNSWLKKDSL